MEGPYDEEDGLYDNTQDYQDDFEPDEGKEQLRLSDYRTHVSEDFLPMLTDLFRALKVSVRQLIKKSWRKYTRVVLIGNSTLLKNWRRISSR